MRSKPEIETDPAPPESHPIWRQTLSAAAHRIWRLLKDIRYAPAAGVALVCLYFAIPRSPAPLSLTVQGQGAQVKIAWNRGSAAVREAQKGEIQVEEDGAKTQIDLDADILHSGTVVYLRKSKNLVVHMEVGDLRETTAFASASAPDTQQEDALREAEVAQMKLQGQADQISRLQEMVDELEKEKNTPRESAAPASVSAAPSPVSAAKAPVPAAKRSETKARPARLTRAAKPEPISRPPAPPTLSASTPLRPGQAKVYSPQQISSQQAVSAPPTILFQTPPRIEGSAAPSPLSAGLIGRPAEPVPAPVTTEARTRTLPRTGTLIWTGRLPKNGSITIDGSRPSSGALTGEVPGFPIRVNVYPADLTPNGLRVYTADSRYAADHVEPPGPRNGWNRTLYLRDPRRARAVSVAEAPRSENGWKRLVLRGGASPVSVVLVEWSAIQR